MSSLNGSGVVYGIGTGQYLDSSGVYSYAVTWAPYGILGVTYHSGAYSYWTHVSFPELDDPIWSTRYLTSVECVIDVNAMGDGYSNPTESVNIDMRENVSGEYKVWNDRGTRPYHDDFSYEPYDSKLPLITRSQYTNWGWDQPATDIVFDANSGLLNLVNRWISNETNYQYGMCLILNDGERDGNGNPVSGIFPDAGSGTEFENYVTMLESGISLNIVWGDTRDPTPPSSNRSSKKPLSVYPEIKEIIYNSRIKSNELNKQFNSLEESALRAILRSRDVKSELNRIQQGTVLSNKTIGLYYEALTFESTDRIYASSFKTSKVMSSNKNILYDTNYGYTTLNPIAQFSKIPRGKRYNDTVSPKVNIYIEDTYEPTYSPIYDILDGTNKSFWVESAIALVGRNQMTIRIEVPPSLTKQFNYIEVCPFPLYGMKILDIKYKNYNGIYTSVVKNLYGGNPLENNQGEPLKLYLSPKEFDGTIKLELEAKDELSIVGFSNVDIKFLDFDNTSKNGHIRFNGLDNKTRPLTLTLKELYVDWYFDSVKAVELITLNNSPITMQLVIGNELANGTINQTQDWTYKLDLADVNTWNLDDLIIQLEEDESIFLEFTMTEYNTTTPVIRGAKIKYE